MASENGIMRFSDARLIELTAILSFSDGLWLSFTNNLPDFQATSSATASICGADIRQTTGFVVFGNVASGKQRTGQTYSRAGNGRRNHKTVAEQAVDFNQAAFAVEADFGVVVV